MKNKNVTTEWFLLAWWVPTSYFQDFRSASECLFKHSFNVCECLCAPYDVINQKASLCGLVEKKRVNMLRYIRGLTDI